MGVQVKGRSAQEWLNMMVAHVDELPALREQLGDKVVYVGRISRYGRTRYGNPFKVGRDGERGECVELFADWIEKPEQAALLEQARAELRGKVLVCHCQRQADSEPACHAGVLVRLVNPGLLAAAEADEPTTGKRDLRYGSHFRAWVAANGYEDAPIALCCGSRSFTAAEPIERLVGELEPGTIVVQGEANGADTLFADAAVARGLPVAGFPALWRVTPWTPAHRVRQGPAGPYDVAAGPLRNRRMLDATLKHPGPVTVYAAVEDLSRRSGTRDMATRAYNAGVPVVTVNAAGERREYVKPHRAPAEPEPAEGVDVHVEGQVHDPAGAVTA